MTVAKDYRATRAKRRETKRKRAGQTVGRCARETYTTVVVEDPLRDRRSDVNGEEEEEVEEEKNDDDDDDDE